MKTSTMFIAIFVALSANLAFADDRFVTEVGCRTTDDVCFAYLDRPVTSTSPCSSKTSIRWNGTNERGKNLLRVLLAAQLSGRSIRFGITQACLDNSPVISYARIRRE